MCLHIESEQDLISFQRCVAIQRAFPGYFSTDVVLSEQNLINLIGCVWGHRALRGARERFACGATHQMCHFREAGGAKNGRLFGRKKNSMGPPYWDTPKTAAAGPPRASAGLRFPPISWILSTAVTQGRLIGILSFLGFGTTVEPRGSAGPS